MIKKLIIIFALGVSLFTLTQWLNCGKFADQLHFSPLDMRLKLEEAIHNDVGSTPTVARAYHNKVTLGTVIIFNSYLHFWDIRSAVVMFSIVGYFGIILGFWYLSKIKIKYKKLIIFLLLIFPLVEVFSLPLPYYFRLGLLSLPYLSLSVFGLWNYTKSHKLTRISALVVLIIFSIWYQSAFAEDLFLNCYK